MYSRLRTIDFNYDGGTAASAAPRLSVRATRRVLDCRRKLYASILIEKTTESAAVSADGSSGRDRPFTSSLVAHSWAKAWLIAACWLPHGTAAISADEQCADW